MAEIKIIVTGDGGTTTISKPQATIAPGAKQGSKPSVSNGSMLKLAVGVQAARQVSNYALSNVGKYTGDSVLQQKINNAQQLGTTIAMFAISPALGAISTAFAVGSTIAEETFRRKQEQLTLSVSRARNGYTDTASIVNSRRH